MSIAAAASSALHGFADFMVGPRGYGASDLGQRERGESGERGWRAERSARVSAYRRALLACFGSPPGAGGARLACHAVLGQDLLHLHGLCMR